MEYVLMSNAALSVIEMTTRAIYARWQLTKLQNWIIMFSYWVNWLDSAAGTFCHIQCYIHLRDIQHTLKIIFSVWIFTGQGNLHFQWDKGCKINRKNSWFPYWFRWCPTINESRSDLAQVLSAEAGTIQWVFLPRLLNISCGKSSFVASSTLSSKAHQFCKVKNNPLPRH